MWAFLVVVLFFGWLGFFCFVVFFEGGGGLEAVLLFFREGFFLGF